MSYYAANNMHSHIRHHTAQYNITRSENTGDISSIREKYTLQDVYNGYAWVVGNLIAWGGISLAAYVLAKPYISYLFGENLL